MHDALKEVQFSPDRPVTRLLHDAPEMRVVVFGLEGGAANAWVNPIAMAAVAGAASQKWAAAHPSLWRGFPANRGRMW